SVDAGYFELGGFGDTLWLDQNGNGIQDSNEPGLAKVQLTAVWAGFDGVAGTPDDKSYTTTTDNKGNYSFVDLPPGNWSVTVDTKSLPAGVTVPTFDLDGVGTPGVSLFTLTTGQTRKDLDFGYQGTASIGDTVWYNPNLNTTQDAGEPGLAGVTVTLSGMGLTLTGTTDANGKYLFENLPAGNFTVQVQSNSVPAELTANFDADGISTVNSTALTLAAGEKNRTTDFAYNGTSSIRGLVYRDDNNDGLQQASEPGLAGETLTLTGTDQFGGSVTRTTTTAADGTYSFVELAAGQYTVTETQPALYNDGLETLGSVGGTVGADVFTAIDLGAGVAATGYNFGERGTTLEGLVFVDFDRDGNIDLVDTGLSGVVLTLLDVNGNTVGTTTTGADGKYIFENLPVGKYTVVQTQPAGYASSTPNTIPVNLTKSGATGLNFGETLSSLAGTVFRDDNNDGAQQTGEPGLAGVTITLTGTTASGVTVQQTTTTGTNGQYQFVNLVGGTYTITETQPVLFGDGRDMVGTSGGTLGNDVLSKITLDGGVDGMGYNFGEVAGGITGVVYYDEDRDGVQDPGEPTIPGVTFVLVDQNGNTVNTFTNNTDGTFSISSLPAGKYTLTQTQPPGYGSSTPNVLVITVPAGQVVNNQNFGETLSTLAGSVYRDDNNNGTRDANDLGLPDVIVTLTGTDVLGQPVTRHTTTSSTGGFLFTGLLSGSYTLTETQPANFNDGQDALGSFGGTLGNDVLSKIAVPVGTDGTNYLFGELGIVDLQITETVNDPTPRLGGEAIFTFVVVNNGPADDTNVVANLTLPPNLRFQSSSTQTGTFNPATNTWTIGSLPNGGRVELQVVVTVLSTELLEIPSVVRGDRMETNLLNNNDQAAVRVPVSDVQTQVQVPPTPVAVGDRVIVTYTVRNNGSDPATGVVASFPVPRGVRLASVLSTNGGVFNPTTGLLNIGDMGVGGTASLQLSYDVIQSEPITFTSTVSSDSVDTNLPNNPDSTPILVTVPVTDVSKQLFLSSTPPMAMVPPLDPPTSKAVAGSSAMIVSGADAGSEPRITVFDRATGQLRFMFNAFDPSFRGGVRVAMGDVTGDGVDDIVAAPGESGGPIVRVFNGLTGELVRSEFVYEQSYRGGVFVTLGDVNGDGTMDIITGTGNGGGPRVRVIEGKTGGILADFFAYEDTQRGGVNVAAGDLDGDGKAEVVAGAGMGGGPRVRAFGINQNGSTREVANFFAYDAQLRTGVFVAVGDTNGDGRADIITGAGVGGGPNVKVFDTKSNNFIQSFFAGDSTDTGGARVATANVDGSAADEIITSSGRGARPVVRTYAASVNPTLQDEFFAFNESFLGGVFVDATRKS
ncbi:MAG: SdrD B-like domain-containing protein, partial [Gemmataceae bacterium]